MPTGLDGNDNPIVTDARDEVIAKAAQVIVAQKQAEIPLLVAVDGIDGAGKSTFADELAARLSGEFPEHTIVRAAIDSFHNPRAVRYSRGRESGEGFYRDSHNLAELCDRLLKPFRAGVGADYRTTCFDEPSDQPTEPEPQALAGNEILLFDGIFLCKPELMTCWDYVVHLDGRERVKRDRIGVDGTDRYTSGMAMYLDAEKPMDRAHLVIDNNDLASPTVVANRAPRDTISPRLASYYNREATARAGIPVDSQRSAWRQHFLDLLATEDRRRVIELGSGPGRDTITFAEHGVAITGLDLSLEAMTLLGAHDIPAINGSLYELPIKTATFEAAWTMSTLMHVPDSRFHEAMAEICRVLQPGVPMGIGLWGGLDSEGVRHADTIDPPRFFSHRSHERTRAMLEAHGSLELFETKDFNTPGGAIYQFAILRVG